MGTEKTLKLHYVDLDSHLIEFKDNVLGIASVPSGCLEDEFDYPYLITQFIEAVIEDRKEYESSRLYDELYLLCNCKDSFSLIKDVIEHFRRDLISLRDRVISLDGNDIIRSLRCFSRYREIVIGIEYDIKSNGPQPRGRRL